MITHTRTIVAALVAGFVFTLSSLVPTAGADEIVIGGLTYKNVRIEGMREGKLYVVLPSGSRGIDLVDVQGLKIDVYPDYAKGDAAMAEKDWAKAADIFEALLDKVSEDYMKVLVGAKLVASLDRAGKFEDAVNRYAVLLRQDQGLLTKAVEPKMVPKDDADLVKRIKKQVEIKAESEADPFVKEFLANTLKRLDGVVVAGDNDPGVGPSLAVGADEAARDLIQEAIEGGKAEDALKMIDEKLKLSGQSLSTLLYQRGQALHAMGKFKDAAISYMRVIVHYRPRSTVSYTPALIGAADTFIELKQPHHAEQLLKEASAYAEGDDELTQRIAAVRAKLK